MIEKVLKVLICAAVGTTVGLMVLGVAQNIEYGAMSPGLCRDPLAEAVIAQTKLPGWSGNDITVKRGSLAIWHGNNAYGLGIGVDGNVLPYDGPKFSAACRIAIFKAVRDNILPTIDSADRAKLSKAMPK